VILGIDVGTHRFGVAAAHEETRFAHPLEVIIVGDVDPVARVTELVSETNATKIVVGLPTGLSGSAGAAVDKQKEFVESLRATVEVEVVEYDERLTTVVANQGLRAAGGKREAQKGLRDAVAAQVMLQGYLDSTS
jgi:putative Holliday junction resolvase